MEDNNFFDEMISSQHPEENDSQQDGDELEDLVDEVAEDNVPFTDELMSGLLPLDVQQAVQKLLKAGKIEREKHPKFYEVLRRDEEKIRIFLQNLAVSLQIVEREGMAFTGRVEDEEGEPVGSLIHVQTLQLHETWVMLILRDFYQEREAAGEQLITIDLQEIESRLVPFLPLSKSESADRNRLVGFLNRLVKKYRILSSVKSEPERYQISSVIRHVVSAEELAILLEDYQKMAQEVAAEQVDHIEPNINTLTEQESKEQQGVLSLTNGQGDPS